jgi:MFS family permease
MAVASASPGVIRTDIPARMDRLPWSRWHWRVVIALGITWIIDGLEVTLVGAISPVLLLPESLHLTEAKVGLLLTAYLVGAVLGSLVFGYLTDRLGRKKLFTVTLGLYLAAAFASAFSWDFWSFAVFRFLTGAGIGGEYSAINSAIDELIPARVRGWVDLAINGTFWLGAAAGSFATIVMLDPRLLPIDVGWRVGFAIGALLGLVIIFFRKDIPESPRWLMTRGRIEEAEAIVTEIERNIESRPGAEKLPEVTRTVAIVPHTHIGFGRIAATMVKKYPSRTVLGLVMVTSQAFLYNGLSTTFPLILSSFYGLQPDRVGLYLVPLALGNFLGPALLGPLFDSWGRKPMISATYLISAVLLVVAGYLFLNHGLTAATQTALWCLIFMFASAAASSAYLTVSEIFPLEMRGLAIALFYSVGTALGGTVAPWAYNSLVGTHDRQNVFYGYLVAAGVLVVTVAVVAAFGVKAERASLEDIAEPLSAVDEKSEPAPRGEFSGGLV